MIGVLKICSPNYFPEGASRLRTFLPLARVWAVLNLGKPEVNPRLTAGYAWRLSMSGGGNHAEDVAVAVRVGL
jgi:hypothetical protein